jgi:hypothetical protein
MAMKSSHATISLAGYIPKWLFHMEYDDMVKKWPTRHFALFSRGCAHLRRPSSTDLSTDGVDKEFYPM